MSEGPQMSTVLRVVIGVAAVLGTIGAVMMGFRRSSSPPVEVVLTPPAVRTAAVTIATAAAPTKVAATSPAPAQVMVHVSGAVARPAVYRLTEGSRVFDALAEAGGLLAEADADGINQAARVVDGQMIYVPYRGTPPPAGVRPTTASGKAAAPSPTAVAGPVNLNTATKAELDALPGIGLALAERIIEHREQNGPYQTPEDIKKVRGIGDALYQQIRDRITAP